MICRREALVRCLLRGRRLIILVECKKLHAGVYSGTGNQDISFQGKGITVSSYLSATYTAIEPVLGRGFTFTQNEIFTSVLNGTFQANSYAGISLSLMFNLVPMLNSVNNSVRALVLDSS